MNNSLSSNLSLCYSSSFLLTLSVFSLSAHAHTLSFLSVHLLFLFRYSVCFCFVGWLFMFVDVSIGIFFIVCFRWWPLRSGSVFSKLFVLQFVFIKGFVIRHFWAGERRVKVKSLFYSLGLLSCHL